MLVEVAVVVVNGDTDQLSLTLMLVVEAPPGELSPLHVYVEPIRMYTLVQEGVVAHWLWHVHRKAVSVVDDNATFNVKT